jgi:hypothetical protein
MNNRFAVNLSVVVQKRYWRRTCAEVLERRRGVSVTNLFVSKKGRVALPMAFWIGFARNPLFAMTTPTPSTGSEPSFN